jgi:hypothetical protein
VSRFSALCHLVISFKIKDGLAELDAHTAIQLAEFKSRASAVTASAAGKRVLTNGDTDSACLKSC